MPEGYTLVREAGGIREWRLESNGLTVLTAPTPVAPVATFCVVYRVGSRDEATGHTGATHLLEHLMFKGTERFCAQRGTEPARVLERLGASFNATTWLDRTSYYATVAVEHLDAVMEIEADRMRNARLAEEDVASERTVVLNELERGENDPADLLFKMSFATAYLEHPYHHPTIGWRSDVEAVTAAVLRRFYDTYYHPDNATAIVAGDVEEEGALELVRARFGTIPPAPAPPPRVVTRESPQRGERRFRLHRAGEVGWVALSWHIPQATHPDLPALSVAAQILGEGVTSRLHQRLVESGRCIGVHAFAWELADPGLFQLFATLAPGVPHEEVEAALREEVARLAGEGPGPEETARARTQVETDLAFHRESPADIASALTETVAQGDWTRFARQLDLVSAVTPGDVRRVAAAYLVDTNLTVGWFVPEDGTGAGTTPASPRPRPCHLRGTYAGRVARRPLPGGGEVAVLPNPHAPTVTVAGSLVAGRALDPGSHGVVPAMTAAMLERGTRHLDRLGLARELEDHGLELAVEAPASLPTLAVITAHGLARELGRLLRLLAEMLRWPTFPAEELERLREQVLGRLAREREDTGALAYAALTRLALPTGHPHRRAPVEEREAIVRSLRRDELERFHAATYGPASLRLAVVGAVDPDEVAARLADALAGWEGGVAEPPAAPELSAPEPGEARIHLPDRPNVDVMLGHAGRLLWGAPDLPAAVLANACLGQSTLTSRLGREVRDRAGLTYGVYSRFFGTLHVPGPWAVALSVAPANLERAVARCREIVAAYVEEGPTEEELAGERLAQAGAYRVGLATNAGVARELAAALAAGSGPEHLDTYPERLLAASREEVVAALRRHIRPGLLSLAVAGSLEA